MSSLKDWFKLLRLFLRCIKTICKSSHHPTSSNKKETLSRSTQLVLPWMIQKCQYSTTFFYPLPPSPVSLTKAMILLIVISQAMSICFVFRTHVYATLLHANCAFKVPSMQLLTAYTEVSHLFVLTRYSGATVHGASVGTHRMMSFPESITEYLHFTKLFPSIPKGEAVFYWSVFAMVRRKGPFLSPLELSRRSLREFPDICLLSYLHLPGSGYCV